jgi:hypothetical protein
MRKSTWLKGVGVALGLGVGMSAWASPTCPTGITFDFTHSVQFGDAFSQSLPLSGIKVQSSPGQIADCLVVATGPSGSVMKNNNALADDAYATPNGPNANNWFRTGDPGNSLDPQVSNSPGFVADFTGDRATSWDVQVGALKTYLAGNAMMLYFNHNQTKSGGTIDEDLFIWGQITMRHADGSLVTGGIFDFRSMFDSQTPLDNFGCVYGDSCFDQTGSNYTSPGVADSLFPTAAAAGASQPNLAAFVRARGHICQDASFNIVECTDPTAVTSTDTNLGADSVANAVYLPELQALLNGLTLSDTDVLSIDLRMGCNPNLLTCPDGSVLNNGYEQLFIVQTPQQDFCRDHPTDPVCTPDLPEPGSLALVGLGLAGVAMARRRYRQGQA